MKSRVNSSRRLLLLVSRNLSMKTCSLVFGRLAVSLIVGNLFISAFGQTPSPTPETPRLKDFGQSLKKKDSKKKGEKKPDTSAESDIDVIRVQTDLVINDVLVVNKEGEAIQGLKQSDFLITENAEPQEVSTFSLGDGTTLPRSIVLLMDYSGSQYPFIETSVAAAKVLVDKLKPADRMAIVTDDVKLLVEFTSDKTLLKKTLDSLQRNALSRKFGKSRQLSALMAILNEMFNNEDVRPIIIFQTDGDELEKLRGEKGRQQTDFSFADVYRAVENSRALIYTVIPGHNLLDLSLQQQMEKLRPIWDEMMRGFRAHDPSAVTEDSLRALAELRAKEQLAIAGLAKLSGGWHDFLEKPSQAETVYSRILSDINNRYIIGYYSRNKSHDGKRRVINIEVKGHPEYVVWGRKFYFAPVE